MHRNDFNLIFSALECEYPGAQCSLMWDDPFRLLISTQLSAQCTDVRVNTVTPVLFEKYPDARSMADADIADIEEIIKSLGLFRSKAKNIRACAVKISEDFGGIVPDTLEELTTLPGTGRKTANLVIGEVFHAPAYVVDTHVKRICGLTGISDGKDATEIEMDLRRLVPPEDGMAKDMIYFSHRMVNHGRAVCVAGRPECEKCCIREYCRKYREGNR